MRNKKIYIIDYGMGNIHSVYNALASLNCEAIVTNKKEELNDGDAFILPGVGAFSKAIDNLYKLDLIEEIKKQVLSKQKNILGICLGMQLFASSSEEGGFNEGLCLIPGKVINLSNKIQLRVPHIGWNSLKIYNDSKLFYKIPDGQDFYFVHKYFYQCDSKYILASTEHDIAFTSAIQYNNIYGVQFHPERSHSMGIRLLQNFIDLI
jgi:imidazole glycerol-phosphate synthase subunit HisH